MDRKWKSGAAAGAPALDNASDGYATAGNPAGGVPATKPGPHWYHMITEELLALITYAGIAFDKTVLTQVRDAILKLIDRVEFNYTFNSDERVWGAGTAAVPTGWTAYGAGASYAKNTTAADYQWGNAGCDITRAGTDCGKSQTISSIPGFGPVKAWQGKKVTYGRWVKCAAAGRARIAIDDGVGVSYSAYHTGGGALEFLSVTRTLDAAATKVEIKDQVDTGNTTATFSGGVFGRGQIVADFVPPGWRGRKAIVVLGHASNDSGAGVTVYIHGGISGAESHAQFVNPFKAVARNLKVKAGTQAGAGESYVYTLSKGGAATALTATISGAAQTEGSNVAAEVEVSAAELIAAKIVISAGAASSRHTFACEFEEIP
jgi:hypothetical protein